MKFIVGKKVNMSQVFDGDGKVHPVTLISINPVTVTQIKNEGKDGYKSVQIGYGEKSKKNIKKPQLGHYKDLGSFERTKEFRVENETDFEVGKTLDISIFNEGDEVVISGTSKGKGFQGVVKRHGFHGGPRSHGQKHSEREAGSIGSAGIQRVIKGMRMAGRMGSDRITLKGVTVVSIDKDENMLYVKGAVPGRRGSWVEIISAK